MPPPRPRREPKKPAAMEVVKVMRVKARGDMGAMIGDRKSGNNWCAT